MKGAKVRWRHLNEDGKRAVDLDAYVVDVQCSGATWWALLLMSDNTFDSRRVSDLEVVKLPQEWATVTTLTKGKKPKAEPKSEPESEAPIGHGGL